MGNNGARQVNFSSFDSGEDLELSGVELMETSGTFSTQGGYFFTMASIERVYQPKETKYPFPEGWILEMGLTVDIMMNGIFSDVTQSRKSLSTSAQ